MRTKVFASVVAIAFLLAGCIGDKEKEQAQQEMSAFKTLIAEQTKRIEALEPGLNELRAKTDDDGKAIFGLNETIEAVKNNLQELSQSQDDLKGKAESLGKLSDTVGDIENRVQALERQIAARKTESATAAVKSTAQKPKKELPKNPPFVVVGVEYRANEPFLSIMTKEGRSLSQIKLVQPPELVVEDWRLKSIESDRAVFVVDGRDVVVSLP
jgi:uncharacterized protein YoxC